MKRGDPLLLLALVVTGMAALALEVVWSRALIPWVGGTSMAQVMTVAIYMGGLFLGASWGVRLCRTVQDPRRLFLKLEAAGALISAIAILSLPAASPLFALLAKGSLISSTTGSALRGLCVGVMILPGTICMGAAFPLAIETLQRIRPARDAAALVYGVNTLGATLGTCLGGFLLVPMLGTLHSIWVVLFVDLVVLALAWRRPVPYQVPFRETEEVQRRGIPGDEWPMLLSVFLGGSVALGLEVLLFRILGMVLGPTARAFTVVLGAYVFGLGLGALLIRRVVARGPVVARRTFLGCWFFVGIVGVSMIAAVAISPEWLLLDKEPGATIAGQVLRRATLAMALLAPLTLAFGASYSAAVASGDTGSSARAARLYASLTLGNIVGLVVAAFVLLPGPGVELGVKALFTVAFLTPLPLLVTRRLAGRNLMTAVVAVVSALLPWLNPWTWDWKVLNSAPYMYGYSDSDRRNDAFRYFLFLEHGFETTVGVVQEGDTRYFTLDGKSDGSTLRFDQQTQSLVGALPGALHPAPSRTLVVGLGTGQSCADLMRFSVEEMECAELSEAVVATLPFFDEINRRVDQDPRLRILQTDARTMLRYGTRQYDVIVSEPSNLWVPGVAHLFTKETFEEAHARLNDDGILLQWLHAYSLETDVFRTILRTMLDVFPHVTLWAASMQLEDGLFICSREPIRFSLEELDRRLAAADLPNHNAPGEPLGARGLLGRFVAGTDALREFAGEGPRTRDSRPSLEYAAESSMLEDVSGRFHQTVVDVLESPAQLLVDPDPELQEQLEGGVERRRMMHRFHTGKHPTVTVAALYDLAAKAPDDREFAHAVASALTDGAANAYSRDPRVAQNMVQQALELDPGHTGALQRRAAIQRAAGDIRGAHATVDQLQANYRQRGVFPRLLRGELFIAENRLDLATAEFQLAVEEEPGSMQALLNLANCHYRARRPAQAHAALQRVLELDPSHPQALEMMAALGLD